MVVWTMPLHAQTIPSWWIDRGVIDTNQPPSDYSPVNQGQLKNIATEAAAALNEDLAQIGGAGSNINAMVASFGKTNDFLPVNVGMLKHVAEAFIARLTAVGYGGNLPWTSSGGGSNDYALVNIGQVKNLFSFNPLHDSDNDGMPDWWEVWVGLQYLDPADASLDQDADGVDNLSEYLNGTHPWIVNVTPPNEAIGSVVYRYDVDGRMTELHLNNSSAQRYSLTPASNLERLERYATE